MPLLPLGQSGAEDQRPTRAQSYFYFIRGTLEGLNGNSAEALRFFSQAQQISHRSPYIKLRQAEEYLNTSDTETAEALLKEIGSQFLNEPEYYVLRSRSKAQNGDYRSGLKDLDRAVNLYFASNNISKAREIILTKVALQADQKDYKGAIKSLQTYLQRNPDDEIAYYFLGKVHSLFSEKKSAKKAYKKALEIRPSFLAATKALGLVYELEGSSDAAFDLYLNTMRAGTIDEEIVQKIVNLSLIREDYPLALEAIALSHQWRPDDLQNNLRAGLIHFKLGNFEEAETFLMTASELEGAPKDRIDFYLANTYNALRRHEESLAFFLKIDTTSDYFPEAVIQASQIYEQNLNKPDEALQTLADAIARKPHLDLVLARAQLLEIRGSLTGAIQSLEEKRKLFVQNERFLLVLGSLQEKSGATDESLETMRAILAFNENNIHALNHIGYSLTERGVKLEEAELLLKRAVQLAPRNGFILDSLGWLYYKTGRYKKALELLRQANVLAPQQTIILEHLGDTLHKLNQIQEALATYRQIIKTGDSLESASEDQETRIVKERVREKLSLLVDSSPRD